MQLHGDDPMLPIPISNLGAERSKEKKAKDTYDKLGRMLGSRRKE